MLKNSFDLDFVLKSFKCSKGHPSRVLLTILRNELTQLLPEKAGE